MSLSHDQAAQTPLTAGRKADLDLKREFEYWLRTLTNKEHRAALAIYRELQDQFPEGAVSASLHHGSTNGPEQQE